MSKSYLLNYNKRSISRAVSVRVDVKRGRLYVPKEYIGKSIDISAQGKIVECAQGVKVNAQGFASIARLNEEERKECAQAVSAYYNKSK